MASGGKRHLLGGAERPQPALWHLSKSDRRGTRCLAGVVLGMEFDPGLAVATTHLDLKVIISTSIYIGC